MNTNNVDKYKVIIQNQTGFYKYYTMFYGAKKKMSFSLEPAALVSHDLLHKIIKASFEEENEWFFFDGSFISSQTMEQNRCDTWLHENFVAVKDKTIIAYFEGSWSRPLDIITGFRMIFFDKTQTFLCSLAFFQYLDYLFINRGCQSFNWIVAQQNIHALLQYERFISKYCGHRIGTKSRGQKSYTGKISDVNLYEITRDEYLVWKKNKINKQ